MIIARQIFIFGLFTATVAAVTPPSTNILLQNETHCKMRLTFQQQDVEAFSLPGEIEANSIGNGNISFSTSWFSTTSQQLVNVNYIVNCNGTNHILTLEFYAGLGYTSDHDYFFQAKANDNSPFLVTPANKVPIRNNHPLVITLFNKEDSHEETLYTTGNDSNECSDCYDTSEGDIEDYQQESMSTDSTLLTKF